MSLPEETVRFSKSLLYPLLALLSLAACDDTSSSSTPAPGAVEADQCPAMGAGTVSPPSPTSSATWTAAESPYILDGSLEIASGVTLTLEPCTVVRLPGGANVNVNGKLVAKGESGRRVRIEAADASAPWAWIDSTSKDLPLDLTYTTISGGGVTSTGAAGSYAAVRLRASASDQAPTPMLRADNLVIEKSASTGLQIIEGAGFTDDSKDLTITGSALQPLTIDALPATGIPTGTYTGNGKDVIDLTARNPLGLEGVDTETTLHDRGVPYRIGSDVDGVVRLVLGVDRGTASMATLILEPGVSIHFRSAGMLDVAGTPDGALRGSLVAKGTAEKSIEFTSDAESPAAGDWLGIFFRGKPPSSTAIDHAVIAYAGGEETQTRGFSCGTPVATDIIATRGAIAFSSALEISSSFLTNSTIKNSASNGIDRGWSGADTDFTATNTFSAITYCTQTQNKNAAGTCPATPSCPKSE